MIAILSIGLVRPPVRGLRPATAPTPGVGRVAVRRTCAKWRTTRPEASARGDRPGLDEVWCVASPCDDGEQPGDVLARSLLLLRPRDERVEAEGRAQLERPRALPPCDLDGRRDRSLGLRRFVPRLQG